VDTEEWEAYITTSTTEMAQVNRPMGQAPSQKLAKQHDFRRGWVFHDAKQLGARWAMDDIITFTLPSHTFENPVLHRETLRDAIFEAYHVKWRIYLALMLKDKKDQDAGKKLVRN